MEIELIENPDANQFNMRDNDQMFFCSVSFIYRFGGWILNFAGQYTNKQIYLNSGFFLFFFADSHKRSGFSRAPHTHTHTHTHTQKVTLGLITLTPVLLDHCGVRVLVQEVRGSTCLQSAKTIRQSAAFKGHSPDTKP